MVMTWALCVQQAAQLQHNCFRASLSLCHCDQSTDGTESGRVLRAYVYTVSAELDVK